MRFLRYGPVGQEKPGLLDNDGHVRDLSAQMPDLAGAVLAPENLARIAEMDASKLPLVQGTPQKDLRLGPCVSGTGKFICIGLNYADHAAETGATWVKVSVDDDPALLARWSDQVPVTLVDGRPHDFYRVSEARLRAALKS